MSATAASTLRERLDRLSGAPRRRPHPALYTPRGFEAVATPYGDALMRQDVLPLPALEPHPGNVAYLDTETTGLSGGAGTYVFAAAIARPIDCGLPSKRCSRPCRTSSRRPLALPLSMEDLSTCLCCVLAG